MANLSSFFPTAGGGGGFTKMKKYSTARSLGDTTNRPPGLLNNSGTLVTDGSAGTSFTLIYDQPAQTVSNAPATYVIKNLRFDVSTALNVGATIPANYFAGATCRIGYNGVNSVNLQQPANVSGNSAFTYADANSTLTLNLSTQPTGAFSFNAVNNLGTGNVNPLPFPNYITVNPANDLGLSDGDQIGYFMVGGGDGENVRSSTANFGGKGGKIIYGTATISNASTNLTITPGIGAAADSSNDGTASTISGGLTLTTADGSQHNGWFARQQDSNTIFSAGPGIMGYGAGGRNQAGGGAELSHGWGTGAASINSSTVTTGGDGAVLIYY